MTFRMDACIAFAELMLNNYFEERPLLDHCIDLDFRVSSDWLGFSST